jgi:tRNA pseudouridine38-40 synthase
VSVIGAGRTDAGVHALGQVANFRIEHALPADRYTEALNFYLPLDIRIRESVQVGDEFHARRDAISKRYRYLISPQKSALYAELRWENPIKIDLLKLMEAASMILGEHDFAPFCVVASQKEDNHCLIRMATWRKFGQLYVFEIRGNRFLHGMVRSLVGAMINVATVDSDRNPRNLTLTKLADIINFPPAERVVFTAPPQGLYLVSVQYSKD